MALTLYHNPQCSKSRQTLALIQEHGAAPNVVEYLKTPPDAATLRALMKQLGLTDPRAMMRTKEAEYKDFGLAQIDDPDALIAAMAAHPRLIERPILTDGKRARIGRPPENVLELLDGEA